MEHSRGAPQGRAGSKTTAMPAPVAGGLLAGLLGGGALLAVGPAVWALQYAFATWRRAGILAFWVGLLAVSLPLMDRLSRSRRVPTIIVRKVRLPPPWPRACDVAARGMPVGPLRRGHRRGLYRRGLEGRIVVWRGWAVQGGVVEVWRGWAVQGGVN